MHESLFAYINDHSKTPLTESDIEVIKDVFIPKKIRKHQYLLQEGEVCKYAAFIVKGAMRQYTVDDKGVEHIVRLFIENWWATDRANWIRQTPSEYNIDAWEDSDVLLLTRADYLNRLMTIPAIVETTMYNYDRFAMESSKESRVHWTVRRKALCRTDKCLS